MSKAYETIVILNAHLSQEQIDAAIEKFLQVIKKQDGEIKLVDRWGKRRLAYEIGKKQYGYYVYVRFNANSNAVQLLEREYKLDESVIRFLTVLVPKAVLENEVFAPRTLDPDAADEEQNIQDVEDATEEPAVDKKTGTVKITPEV